MRRVYEAACNLILGSVIVILVVAFPKGIVGFIEEFRARRRESAGESTLATTSMRAAE